MTFLRACLAAVAGLILSASVHAQNNGSSTMLDTLFAKLQTATDPSAIQSLEAAIWEQWTMVPGDAERQLMMRGIAEMEQQELQWLLGNFTASIADICETIKREPRHFGAYSGLGMIRAQMNEPGRAVAAFQLAKKYNPHIVGLDDEIERLKAMGGEPSDDPLGCGQRTAGR